MKKKTYRQRRGPKRSPRISVTFDEHARKRIEEAAGRHSLSSWVAEAAVKYLEHIEAGSESRQMPKKET